MAWDVFAEVVGAIEYIEKGGAGSGNWGHAGRKGKRGGSAPKGAGSLQFRQVDVSAMFSGGYGPGISSQPPPKRERKGKPPPENSQLDVIDKKSFSPQEQEYLADAVKSLPQEHLNMVREIIQEDLGTTLGGECGIDRRISMNKHQGTKYYDSGTITHEIGHAVMYESGSPHKEGSHTQHFRQLYYEKLNAEKELKKLPMRAQAAALMSGQTAPSKFPTAYARTNHEELFAESYMLYVKSPAKLYQSDPGIYNYMRDNVFGGVEY